MLCTRYSPVRRLYCYPLDLHVLSLPLAFILSQDQTLHCKKKFVPFHFVLCKLLHPHTDEERKQKCCLYSNIPILINSLKGGHCCPLAVFFSNTILLF